MLDDTKKMLTLTSRLTYMKNGFLILLCAKSFPRISLHAPYIFHMATSKHFKNRHSVMPLTLVREYAHQSLS